jgi:DNA-binding IscR family transcriptional regulator
LTFEQIAGSVNTNPVVIRRLLGLLHEDGIVESKVGVVVGWRLKVELKRITLLDVYDRAGGHAWQPQHPGCEQHHKP